MARVLGLLGWLALVLVGVGAPGDLVGVAAVVAVAVAVLVVSWSADDTPVVGVRARVLRERARGSAFLRTRDPDADGRVRPRAPGWGLVA